MRTVTINKGELLDILTANRDKHEAEYKDAYEGYLKACLDSLESYLKRFKAGECEKVRWSETPPVDNTKDYNRVIHMLGLSVDEVIELTHEEFQNYVEDDWHWKESWRLSNSKYSTFGIDS